MDETKPYNPLDKSNLGISVADNLLTRPMMPLAPHDGFEGAGIYAIYYEGNHTAYRKLSEHNQTNPIKIPIYVGKAIPSGARKGGFGLGLPGNKALHTRLKEHARSIDEAGNLNLDHFLCRHLMVDDIWIPLGEAMLIERYQPVWNVFLDGFGNHDPGSGRYNQRKSPWDMIHPGRAWADKCQPNSKTVVVIERELKDFLDNYNFDAFKS